MESIKRNYYTTYNYKKDILRCFSNTGQEKRFHSNSYINLEDIYEDYLFIILDGKVKQYLLNHDGQEKTIFLLSQGDIFGEIAIAQQNYDFVITKVLEPTLISKVNKKTFFKVVKQDPEILNPLFQMLTSKVKTLTEQIHDASFYSCDDRLFSLLTRLSVQYGQRTNKGVKINIKLTHQELANMICCTRSTVTRSLKKLENEGKIYRDGKYIFVL